MDKDYILELMSSEKIEFSEHIDKIENRKGRPSREFVRRYLANNAKMLYKIEKVRCDRLMLTFYMSRKYDLVLIAMVEDKVLKIITYYIYLKRRMKL